MGRVHGDDGREFARDNYRRVPSPLPRDGSYVPLCNDDRHSYRNDRKFLVDLREPGFNARSVLVQGLVDQNRAYREGLDRDRPSGGRVCLSSPKCFRRAIRVAEIPHKFRLATGVSKFTSESKPDTWLKD